MKVDYGAAAQQKIFASATAPFFFTEFSDNGSKGCSLQCGERQVSDKDLQAAGEPEDQSIG